MNKIITSALVGLLLMGSCLVAQNNTTIAESTTNWLKIGEKSCDFTLESDEIKVTGEEYFSALKFVVSLEAIKLLDIDVFYEDDTKETVNINKVIHPDSHRDNGKGVVMKLKTSTNKAINKVVFTYRTMPNNSDQKAKIEIWGRKVEKNQKGKSN